MVKLTELNKSFLKEVELWQWIKVTIRNILRVEEQLELWLTEISDLSWNDLIRKEVDIALKLIVSWNITSDDGEILPVTEETFNSLPIWLSDIENIFTSCESFKTLIDKKKKNTEAN